MKKILIIGLLSLMTISCFGMKSTEQPAETQQQPTGLLVSFEDPQGRIQEVFVPDNVIPLFKTLDNIKKDLEQTEAIQSEAIPLGLKFPITRLTMEDLIKIANYIVGHDGKVPTLLREDLDLHLREDRKELTDALQAVAVAYYLDASTIVDAYCQELAAAIKYAESETDSHKLAEFIIENIPNYDITFTIADKMDIAGCMQTASIQRSALPTILETERNIGSIVFNPHNNNQFASLDLTIPTIRLWKRDQDGAWAVHKKIKKPAMMMIGSISFNPDWTLLAARLNDTVDIWEQNQDENWRLAQNLSGHTGVSSVAFSPNGLLLASASSEKIIFWKQEQNKQWQSSQALDIDPAQGGASSIAFHPAGHQLASSGFITPITIWKQDQANKWHLGQKLPLSQGESAQHLAFSPDGQLLASSISYVNPASAMETKESIRIWQRNAAGVWQEAPSITELSSVADAVAFMPNTTKQFLATGGQEPYVSLWEKIENDWIRIYSFGYPGNIKSIAFSSDGSLLAYGGLDKKIYIQPLRNKQIQELFKPGTLDLLTATTIYTYCYPEERARFSWPEAIRKDLVEKYPPEIVELWGLTPKTQD